MADLLEDAGEFKFPATQKTLFGAISEMKNLAAESGIAASSPWRFSPVSTMHIYNRSRFFQDLQARELSGIRGAVRCNPLLGRLSQNSGSFGAGELTIEHDGATSPPLAIAFGKTSINYHLVAVSDEDGFVSFYDTRRKLSTLASGRENAAKARVCDWVAHHNAIFDICWNKDDTQILTASGDQTIKIWNVEKNKCIGSLIGHTGSVKSLCSHASSPDLVVSGSRDGSFAIWDLRCKPCSKGRNGEVRIMSTAVVNGAHVSIPVKRGRRGKPAKMSITSVLYLKDEISIATAGASDSIIKFWDTRHLKSHCVQTQPCPESSPDKERRLHGISSLSQDSTGVFIVASCMDNRIYLHDVLRLHNGHVKILSGARIESFYVKSAISPDATHVLSGSSDGHAYLWQVDKPDVGPMALKGHDGEVTAVDWCPSETGIMATSSDDFMVRIWNLEKGDCLFNTRSPSTIRKRVMAVEKTSRSKFVLEEQKSDLIETSSEQQSPAARRQIEFGTPESAKKRSYSFSMEELELQKTPDSAVESPSSVLNPPPSLKRRTIRDYFTAYHEV